MLTSNQLQILAVFVENPDKDFYLSQIGRIIGKQPGVFQKGINALEKEGWLIVSRRGNQRVFKINRNHPLFSEIKALIRKVSGGEAILKKVVNDIDDIRIALIYGSYAKDSMRSDSDIDLLVVVEKLKAEDILIDALAKVEKKIQREVNYKLYTVKDFNRRRKTNDPFLSEVLADKHIILKGVS